VMESVVDTSSAQVPVGFHPGYECNRSQEIEAQYQHRPSLASGGLIAPVWPNWRVGHQAAPSRL
jgi:hypothetical protein